MPGPNHLLINGPAGQVLGGGNMAIDTHLSQVLVEWERRLSTLPQRPMAYPVWDSAGAGLPIDSQYVAAGQAYPLAEVDLLAQWQPVTNDPDREVVLARWRDPVKAEAEVPQLVLMRRLADTVPTRIYPGNLPPTLAVAAVSAPYRQRGSCQEGVSRELVNGVNLNPNFGYPYQTVPNRTVQRQWTEAQPRVEVSQRTVARPPQAVQTRQPQAASLRQTYHPHSLRESLHHLQPQALARQTTGQPVRRCQQQLARAKGQLDRLKVRYQQRPQKLLAQLRQQRCQHRQTSTELSHRQAAPDPLDTASLCRERPPEKDQLRLNLQLLLGNLHPWAQDHYFAPPWQQLQLQTALDLIYRKSGRGQWNPQAVKVVLAPYPYPEQQHPLEVTCRRFNTANLP